MASTLAERNFKVTILEWDRSSKLSAVENVKNICVHRLKLKAPYGSKLILMLPVWWIYISLFLLSNNFDVAQPQNFDNLFVTWILSRAKGMKIVYDIADFYADTYVPPKMVVLRNFVAWLERTLIKAVDVNIIVDDSRLKQVDLPSVTFSVIYNSLPDRYEEFKIRLAPELISDLRFTLFYAGILDKDRGLDTVVAVVQDMPDVKLIVAGFGRMEKEFSDSVKSKRNIEFLGRVPYDSVLKLTFLSDCLIALYDPSIPNNVFASPNKLFESMHCGKPIIVSDGTAMSNIVKREKCGFVVNYGDVKQLRELIVHLKNDRRLLDNYGKNGRKVYERNYVWSLMEARLMTIYSDLTRSVNS